MSTSAVFHFTFLTLFKFSASLIIDFGCLQKFFCQVMGVQPDIIHVHEWQTGALPLLYWDMYQNLSLKVSTL